MVKPKSDEGTVLTSDLVSESLSLDDGNVVNDSLVGVEITGQPMQSHLSSSTYFW